MKNALIIIVVILLIALGAWALFFFRGDAGNNGIVEGEITEYKDLIRVFGPKQNAVVSSPLRITGEARGNWYFEADFPVWIEDANGNVLGQHYATAKLDPNDPDSTWMTVEYVPFESELLFSMPTTNIGVLVLAKDNPSGLPENDDEVRIPVQFVTTGSGAQQVISLYYYDPSLDEDANGNILCSKNGLVSVKRTVPINQTPIQDAIRLLIRGEITAEERARGITTEYPLDGFELTGASFENSALTLGFKDPNNKTSGGSCRASILWLQISETALQFPQVSSVRFIPEYLFQP